MGPNQVFRSGLPGGECSRSRSAFPRQDFGYHRGQQRNSGRVLQNLGAKVTDQEVRIDLASDVLFDFDKYTLRPEGAATLGKVAQVAVAYPQSSMTIEGHTDGKGAHPYNMKLSEERATAVKSWLVQNAGIQAARISTRGWGETRPAAPNKNPDGSDNPSGRQKNRRVEIVLRRAGL